VGKIFAFIGSPLKEKSNTFTFTKMILDRIIELDNESSYEILTAGHLKLNYCKGCWLCMTKGDCPQDKMDDMTLLKQKLLDADFIIWGSPVYTMAVTAQMKTFLDRLASWYHNMRLAGKPGMTIATTAHSGIKEVNELLGLLLCASGVKIVGSADTIGYFPGVLGNPEEALKKAHETAQSILPWVKGIKKVETDEFLEECFIVMKNKVTYGRNWLPADYRYWEENKMLNMNSFAELLETLQKTKC
jgi:multimeric flavodoxin WrbA